jgi:uncharacterized protein involved in exopolysaccharide biosynthesis
MIAQQTRATESRFTLQSPHDVVRITARHQGRFWTIFLGTMALVAAGLMLSPRTYQSEIKLFVRVGRESVSLDPTATTGQMISVYDSRENEIASVEDVLHSRVVLEHVVDSLGTAAILDRAENSPADREKAVQQLESAIGIYRSKKSCVIAITAKARSPQLAQRIAQCVVEGFHEQHLRVNRTAGSREFFAAQTELLERQLAEAKRRVSDAKSEFGLVSIDGQKKAIEDQTTALETAIVTGETDFAAAEAAMSVLKQTLAKTPETLVTQKVTGFFDDAAERTRQQLYSLQIREQELLATFTAKHPQVIAVRGQIAQAERILEVDRRPSSQSTSAANPAHQQVQLQLLAEQSRADSLKAKVQALYAQRGRLQDRLRLLNDHEGRVSQLNERVAQLESSYRACSERLEQARLDQALGNQRISNVNIVQPATFISKPVQPKKRLIAGFGFVAALLGGFGFAAAGEYRQTAARQRMQSPFHPALAASN